MKTLLVSPNFYPKAGGVESHLIEVIRGLSGLQFAVLTNWRPGIERAAALLPNVEFHYVWPSDISLRRWFTWSAPTMGSYRLLVASLELLRSLNRRNLLSRIDADVVHFHYLEMDQADRLARKFGLNSLIGPRYQRAVAPVRERSALLLTDHTVFTSAPEIVPDQAKMALLGTFENIVSVDRRSFEVVEEYQRSHGGRSWLIPNSVDVRVFRERHESHQEFRVGMAARAGKAGEEILESVIMELGTDVQWSFALAGDNTELRKKGFVQSAPGAKVLLNADYTRMPEFYSSIDLLINPYPGEGVGRTTLEALACGTPVIGIGTGDKYPIRNGETGYLLPPDARLIAATIRNLVRNPEGLAKMGKHAREAIVTEFSNDVVLPKLRAVYETIGPIHAVQTGIVS